jgi:alkanesulfonate monooxygenase SsuD/methylene tetrahydromethanopterin reductase-like flavin-dependent oxidoreductase (luciferase family)
MILPETRWSEAVHRWRLVDELGFDSAWTYDHLSWRELQDGTWLSAFPVLSAAACITSRITLGTLVTSPNFRHPVTLAKDAIAVDDISGGRFVLGIGAGSVSAGDSNVITQEALPRRTRTARFEEFVTLTDRLLREPITTYDGTHFSAHEARMAPGCVQKPRVAMAIAGSGPRALALAARHGQAWVTVGPTDWAAGFTAAECLKTVTAQVGALRGACRRIRRDDVELDRIFVVTDPAGDFLTSPSAFQRRAEAYATAGITHLVVHWPRTEGVYAASQDILHRIASKVLTDVQALPASG